MNENKVGEIPEFTEPGAEEKMEEPSEPVAEEEVAPEQEQLETEEPQEEAPIEPSPIDDGQKAIQGLETERAKLLDEIKTLRGTRRELKQGQIDKVDETIEALEGVNPQDVEVVEKILKSKGYITKDEAQKMASESIKQSELDAFVEKYPEYKPENDPDDLNWSRLQRELEYYRMPSQASKIREVLERAHRAIQPQTGDSKARKHRVAVASHGSGGVQQSSERTPQKKLSDTQKSQLLRGGWTEEEIKNIEK